MQKQKDTIYIKLLCGQEKKGPHVSGLGMVIGFAVWYETYNSLLMMYYPLILHGD